MRTDKYRGTTATKADAIAEIRAAISAACNRLGIASVLNNVTIWNAQWTPPDYDGDYGYWEQLGEISAVIYYHPIKRCPEEKWQEIIADIKQNSFKRGNNVHSDKCYKSVKLKFVKSEYEIQRNKDYPHHKKRTA